MLPFYCLRENAGCSRGIKRAVLQVEALKSLSEPAILGIFKDDKSAEFKAFSKTADKLADDFSFGHTFDADIVEGASAPPAVLIFKDSTTAPLTFSGKYKPAVLEEWIESKAPPILPELDQYGSITDCCPAVHGTATLELDFGVAAGAPRIRRHSTRLLSRPSRKCSGSLARCSPQSSTTDPRSAISLTELAMRWLLEECQFYAPSLLFD